VSQENDAQVARLIAEGISSGDLRKLETNSDPDIEYTSRFTAVEGRTYRGRRGWSDYLSDLELAWKDFTVTVRAVVPAGPGRLVAEIHVTASARGSGVPIDESGFAVWEFRGGKALRGRSCLNRHEALRAAGLEE
jgi:ketosteroid isomerase-like protein